jgi:CheY-like chemotaxis protein
MFMTQSHVLVVDDEPDVLSVTRLALKHVTVFGLPVRFHTASSRSEAVDLLNTTLSAGRRGRSLLAAALIDVVMETDQAGLELCRFIREDLGLKAPQVYLRTGQPGVAPARSVIDEFDVSGYLTKHEATEDKLYTVVKSGVRQAAFMNLVLGLDDGLTRLIQVARTRRWLGERLAELFAEWHTPASATPPESADTRVCCLLEGKIIAGSWGAGDGLARRDELLENARSLEEGTDDQYAVAGNDVAISIAASPATQAVLLLMRGTVPFPEWEIVLYHKFLRSFAALWKSAA